MNIDEFAAYRHASHGRMREEFTKAMIVLKQLQQSTLNTESAIIPGQLGPLNAQAPEEWLYRS